MRRTLCRLSLVACSLTLLLSGTAHADAGDESRLVAAANRERASAHIGGLRPAGDLADIARRHAAAMASGDRIYHNPNLQSQVRNWRIVAENVGRGSDADWVHGAFMASASHRAIILDGRVTELGVGSFRKGGLLYVVEVFRLPKSAAAPVAAPRPAPPPRRAAAPPAPAPAPAPAPVVAPPPPEPPPAVDPAMIGLLDKIVAPPAPAQQLVRHSASLPPSPSQRAWRVGLAVSTLLVASALLRGAVASVVIRRPRLARD